MNPSHTPLPALRRRYREDGWTGRVQREFFEALAESGSVAQACKVVKRSTSTAYRLRSRPDAHAFRAAWTAATALAYRQVFELAMDRVVGGQEVPVFHDGEHVGFKTLHSDRLICFMLNHLQPRPAAGATIAVPLAPDDSKDIAFGEALAALDTVAEFDGLFYDATDAEVAEAVAALSDAPMPGAAPVAESPSAEAPQVDADAAESAFDDTDFDAESADDDRDAMPTRREIDEAFNYAGLAPAPDWKTMSIGQRDKFHRAEDRKLAKLVALEKRCRTGNPLTRREQQIERGSRV